MSIPESGVPGTAVPERIGKSEHPLPDGHFGKNVIDEVGGRVRLPPHEGQNPRPSRGQTGSIDRSVAHRRRDDWLISFRISIR